MTTPADPAHSSSSVTRTVFKNTLFITLGSVAIKAINFLYGVYVVRRLGDDRLGQYSTVLAWVSLFQIFAELGLSQYVMREIARDRQQAPRLFWNLVVLRLMLAMLAIIGITSGAVAVGYSAKLVLGVFIYTWTFALAAFEAPMETVLTANERLGNVTGLTVFVQLISNLLGALALFAGLDFIALLIIGLFAMLPQMAAAMWTIRRYRLLTGPPRIDVRLWPGLLRAGLPFGIISLALTIAFSIDTVMLSWFVSAREVGWYHVGYGLVRSLVVFLTAFSVAMVPSLSRAYVTDVAQVERWYFKSVKFILLLSAPLAVGGMLVASALVIFLYTPSYLPVALGLQILIWDVPLLMFTAFCGNMTTVVGEERAAARIYSINAIANIILNLYAIPRFGMIGAALVTVITDLIGALQFHFLLRRKMHLPNLTWVVGRVGLASAALAFLLKLAGDMPLFGLVAIGGFSYGVLAIALRLVGPEEWALVRRLVKRERPTGR